MKQIAQKIFLRAIDKNKPARLIDEKVSVSTNGFEIDDENFSLHNRPIYLIAAGKASEAMAEAFGKKLNIEREKKICIAPKDNGKNSQVSNVINASHPYPNEKSQMAANKLIEFIKNISKRAVVLFALSGGTSALVCKPADGISIEEIAEINKLLLNSGASIHEINGVRKHLSAVKGGQLLRYFHPDITLIDLVISDVPGDDLESIGSGLTVPDSTTFQDAYHTLLEFDLWKKMSRSARNVIEKGLTGEISETLKSPEQPIRNHHSFIIGSAQAFAGTMGQEAEIMGYAPIVAESYYDATVDDVIDEILDDVKNKRDKRSPQAFIYYGESTLNVTGSGKGGRNQAMALRAAAKIDGTKKIAWLSAGTDGIDGPTDAAGAVIDGETINEAMEKGLNADTFIDANNSYHFHVKMNTLLKTGPTGNNLMDVVLILMGKK